MKNKMRERLINECRRVRGRVPRKDDLKLRCWSPGCEAQANVYKFTAERFVYLVADKGTGGCGVQIPSCEKHLSKITEVIERQAAENLRGYG